MQHFSFYLKFLRTYEILISSALVICVTFALVFTLLIPNFAKSQQIFENERVLKVRLSQLKQKDEFLAKINYDSYQETLPKIFSVLPFQKDFVSLFDRFDQLQQKTGVTLSRSDFALGVISTGSAQLIKQTVKNSISIPMTMEVLGTKSQVQNFLDALVDLSGRIITITDIQWQLKEDGQMQALIKGKTFFALLPTTLGNIDTPLATLSKSKQGIFNTIAEIPTSLIQEEPQQIPVGKKNLFD